ncbi:MAG: nitrilase-related carbon-nitrogen hydrolase, partial [Limnobacter sp.]
MNQPMSKPMTVASLQMIATPDLERNLDIAQRLIGRAAKQGARMVLLPEYFCLMGH